MTFKNKKNLFHTKKRIKRIKSKDSKRHLSGGSPNDIFTISSSSTDRDAIITKKVKMLIDEDPYLTDAFQLFIETKSIYHNLKSIGFNGYGTGYLEVGHGNKFTITAIDLNEYFTAETINKQICMLKYDHIDNAIRLLSNDSILLERFMDKIVKKYGVSLWQSLRRVD